METVRVDSLVDWGDWYCGRKKFIGLLEEMIIVGFLQAWRWSPYRDHLNLGNLLTHAWDSMLRDRCLVPFGLTLKPWRSGQA